MIRALLFAAALAVAGCGDDTTSSGVSTDMSQPVLDVARVAVMCGVSTCTGGCSACLPLGGGVCVPPCMTADPNSCSAPAMCHPLGGDADGGGGATLAGACGGFDGYCG
ncbi:MAG: hypothetical protein LC659_10385 [Myxococcales bacterium]|nr:hypothetical protein [Myxococcales bacterium]